VLGFPGNGKCLPVGAEIALQRPQVLVTSTMAGGAEAHSHIAPSKLLSKDSSETTSSPTSKRG